MVARWADERRGYDKNATTTTNVTTVLPAQAGIQGGGGGVGVNDAVRVGVRLRSLGIARDDGLG